MGRFGDDEWRPYVPVAERRRRATRKIVSMKKTGRDVSPVEVTGRRIATTFWGEAWCKNLEAYSDYENRLPRGRTYVRNGSVLDLQIEAGRVRALVSGNDLYTVSIAITSLKKKRWKEIKGQCAGQIDSLVELLQGSISKGVMEVVTRKGQGLFPSPGEIRLDCSCPDWATMCKHVAASLYGVGARLDHRPELLFTLRGVDPTEMVETAADRVVQRRRPARGRVLEAGDLSSVFGVEIDMGAASPGRGETSTGQVGKREGWKPRAKKGAARRPKAAPGKATASKRASKKATRTTKTTTKTTKKVAGEKQAARKAVSKATRAPRKKAATKATGGTAAKAIKKGRQASPTRRAKL